MRNNELVNNNNKNMVSNNTNHILKYLEKMFNRVINYLDKCEILYKYHFGFGRKTLYSITSAICLMKKVIAFTGWKFSSGCILDF